MTQFLIGMAIVLPVMIVLAVFNKSQRAIWVTVSVCLGVAAAGALFLKLADVEFLDQSSGSYVFGDDENTSKKHRRGKDKEEEEGEEPAYYLDIVRCLLENDDVDNARQILLEYGQNISYDANYLTLTAQVYDLTGYADRAKRILDSLEDADLEAEDVSGKISKEAETAAMAFQAIRQLSEGQGGYIGNEDELYSYIDDWADDGFGFCGLPSLDKAVLAADLFRRDYSDIAKSIMNTPDSDTLLVASQLSRRGLLDDSDIRVRSSILNRRRPRIRS